MKSMALAISLLLIVIVCAFVFRFLPAARFWETRGCTGWIVKAAREREEERQNDACRRPGEGKGRDGL